MLLYILIIEIFRNSFKAFPVTIIVAMIVIALSVLMSIVVYLTIFFSRIRAANIYIKTTRVRALISYKLNQYLFFMESVSQVTRGDFKRLVNEFNKIKRLNFENKLVRQVLVDQLVYLRKNFTAKTSTVLRNLYQSLGLQKFSLRKLNTSAWQVKAQGIAELREMEPAMTAAVILSYTNSPNDDLRVEAQAAYIGLNSADPFSFLNNTTEILIEWHQIILFDAIINNDKIVIPSFTKWLSSSNQSVIIFCIKLITHYMQSDAIPALIQLMDHRDTSVQNRAVNALGKLNATTAEHIMIDRYPTFSESCKLEVLKALGRIKSLNSIPFVRTQFLTANSFNICKYAMYSYIAITGYNQAKLSLNFPDINFQQESIINHCFDQLIDV